MPKQVNNSKRLSVRLPSNHPIFSEENKTQIVLDALNMYYAVKLYTEGKLSTEMKTIKNVQDQEKKKEKLPINMTPQQQRAFLQAFLKK